MPSHHALTRAPRGFLALLAVWCLLGTGLAAQTGSEAQVPLDVGAVVLDETRSPFRRVIDFAGSATPDLVGTRPSNLGTQVHLYIDPYGTGPRGGAITTVSWGAQIATNDDPIEVGDLDGDGQRDDILLAAGNQVALLRGDGWAVPVLVHRVPLPFTIEALAVGDLNGDGTEDALILGQDDLIISLSPASPAPTPHHVGGLGLGAGVNVAVIPLANGHQMIVAGNQQFLYTPGGALQRLGPIAGLTLSGTWCAGDIDGDGDRDAVLFSPTREYQVLRQGASGQLTLEAARPGGAATDLFDVDGDGDLDGACCGGGGTTRAPGPYDSYMISHFEFSENDGQGNFAPSRRFRGYGATRLAGVVDIDDDGDLDWVAGRTILFARDNKVFDRPYTPVSLDRGAEPFMTPTDLDQDGDLDLHWNQSLVAAGNGKGGGTLEATTIMGPTPAGFAGELQRADWNGDGLVDAIAPLAQGGAFASGQGGGVLAWEPGTLTLGGRPELFRGEGINQDIDGDGHLDRVVVDSTAEATLVAFADGHGDFLAATTTPTVEVFEFADFDGNGLLDALCLKLLNSRHGRGELVILYQTAPRQFGPPVNLGTGVVNEGRPFITDLDGDGRLDILYSPAVSTRHNLLWNLGGVGAFLRQILHAGTVNQGGKMSYARLDLDGDGTDEILASPAPYAPGACVVLRFNAAPFSYVTGVTLALEPWMLADVDGDGDLDIYDQTEGTIARNLEHHGAPAGACAQYGQGTAGTGGLSPLLGAVGPFRPGGTTTVKVSRARGGALAVLVFSARPDTRVGYPYPGITTYIDPFAIDSVIWSPMFLSGAVGAMAAGQGEIQVPLPPAIAGVEVHHQVFVVDPFGPSGWAASNGLSITYGQ